MKYYIEQDPEDFQFWGGARDRMNNATEEQIKAVYERLEEYTNDSADWSETAINDFVWFECDDIFFEEDSDDE